MNEGFEDVCEDDYTEAEHHESGSDYESRVFWVARSEELQGYDVNWEIET